MEKKSIEQLARRHVDEVICEPMVAPIIYRIKEYEPYCFIHSINVAFVAAQIGIQRGFFGGRLHNLIRGGLLHDCGKLFIPVEILTKPDYLTVDEFDIVKEHSKRGAEFIKDMGFDDVVLDIVLHHHERLDGSGYPDGIVGDQIREETKIIMVVDAWDAMTSERPYKSSMSGEYVFEELAASEVYSRSALRLLKKCTDT